MVGLASKLRLVGANYDEGGWIMIVTRNKEDMSYKKHDKTRFETNVQTLWVENTYDFYIDIIR